jgi:hypothetical protein
MLPLLMLPPLLLPPLLLPPLLLPPLLLLLMSVAACTSCTQSNGGRAHYGTAKVTDPKHTVASYTASGLPPGRPYTFTVTPV